MMPKKVEESEAAPSGDVIENEDENTAPPQPKPESKPAPVIEQVENHETVPAWFKPFGDQLSSIAELLKPKPEPKPAEPKPESEISDVTPRSIPKKSKIKFWRTF